LITLGTDNDYLKFARIWPLNRLNPPKVTPNVVLDLISRATLLTFPPQVGEVCVRQLYPTSPHSQQATCWKFNPGVAASKRGSGAQGTVNIALAALRSNAIVWQWVYYPETLGALIPYFMTSSVAGHSISVVHPMEG